MISTSPSFDKLKYWLALLRTPDVGSKKFLTLLNYHDPEQLFYQPVSRLANLKLSNKSIDFIKSPNWDLITKDVEWIEQSGNEVITIHDSCYPLQLKEIDSPPPLLFILGNKKLLSQPQISIVGSRNPSAMGKQTAEKFAYILANHGFTITSGLALGIDASGHQGALKAGGHTIAVAGTGLDRVYPASNKALAKQIANTGAIISEFPPGTPAKANHFPRRNRIISGLCVGLLVVEATKYSGSLITAKMALEANREIFAIPGSIHSPLASGCNSLIKKGAKLVENIQDILDELGVYEQKSNAVNLEKTQPTLSPEQQNLLNLIMFSPTSVDWLVQETGSSVESVLSMLLILELQDCIATTPGGYIRIK